jgi:hypothetical protein
MAVKHYCEGLLWCAGVEYGAVATIGVVIQNLSPLRDAVGYVRARCPCLERRLYLEEGFATNRYGRPDVVFISLRCGVGTSSTSWAMPS